MVKIIEVKTSLGVFEIMKPKAGVRNRALIKAESSSGTIKRTVFMTEILPKIISRRPEGVDKDTPIEQILDSLEIEDYDSLVEGVDGLMEENLSAAEKKS